MEHSWLGSSETWEACVGAWLLPAATILFTKTDLGRDGGRNARQTCEDGEKCSGWCTGISEQPM